MNNTEVFDSARDRAIICNGGFFCRACLVGCRASERSQDDPRYCKSCYDFMAADAAATATPANRRKLTAGPAHQGQEAVTKLPDLSGQGEICHKAAGPGQRGRKSKVPVPVEVVKALRLKGYTVRQIAGQIPGSNYRTIARMVARQ